MVEWESVPLVPVTVARYVPEAELLQLKYELPEPPLMLFGEREHEKLVELVVTERSTVPVNPLRELTWICELKLAPFWMILFGLAVIEKSGEGEV